MFISLFAFLFVFTVVVLVHELGHFLAARRAGVKVFEFSIGFPFSPRIATLFVSRETEFTIRWLPLGGFVRFSKGDNDETIELFETSRMNRAFILSAGSLLNILFAFLVCIPVFLIMKNVSTADAIAMSAKAVWSVVEGTAALLVNAASGKGTLNGMVGPVGIAVFAGKAAAKGILNLFYFAGMLSLSLGIMNLLPFPALDGGQLLMLLIEAARKKRMNLRTYQVVNAAGLALFLALTLLVTYRDIARLCT